MGLPILAEGNVLPLINLGSDERLIVRELLAAAQHGNVFNTFSQNLRLLIRIVLAAGAFYLE